MRSRAYSKCADRLGDVLEVLFAAILEANIQLAFDLAGDLFGHQDATRIGDPLQPHSNVDPVALEVAILPNDHVTKVEPIRSLNVPLRSRISVAHLTAAKGLANWASAPSPVVLMSRPSWR